MKYLLDKNQIEHLHKFVVSKGVKYKDVRIELVDHLATQIEELLDKDSSISYDQALKKVYQGFPITGFYLFVKNQEDAMMKYWQTRMWIYIRRFLGPPKVLLLLLLTFTLFMFAQAIPRAFLIIFLVTGALYFAILIRMMYFQFVKESEMNSMLTLKSYYTGITNHSIIFLFSSFYVLRSHGIEYLSNNIFCSGPIILHCIFNCVNMGHIFRVSVLVDSGTRKK